MNLLRTLRTFGMQEWRSSSNVLKTAGQFRMCSAEAGESEEAETPIDPAKDRRIPTPLEVGLRYMESKAYQTTYGELPVYTEYRRNHKGQLPPKKTRKSCTRKQIISTGNPCPICRDEYLVLEPENVKLLKQFISEHTGQILSYSVTGLCQRKHNALVVAIIRAKEQGRIVYDVPFREYNYDEYISKISVNE